MFKQEENKSIREFEEFKKAGDFEVRYTSSEPDAVVSIYDKKDVAMKIVAAAAHGESPTLWSNNPSFVAIAQERFERLWSASSIEFPTPPKRRLKRIERHSSEVVQN
jgi:hypothetical protein